MDVDEDVVRSDEDALLSVPVPSASRGADKASTKARAKDAADAALEAVRKEQGANQRARLAFLLGDAHSDFFAHFLQHSTGKSQAVDATKKVSMASPSRHRAAEPAKGSKKSAAADVRGKGHRADEEEAEFEREPTPRLTRQPDCITGEMRDYQLEGLNWMIGLHHNGLNGILADEMGLGKTLQTISLLGYCHEYLSVDGPHIILVPKSTLANWQKEVARWCPVLKTLSLHGDKDERAEIIRKHVQPGVKTEDREWNVLITTYEVAVIEKSALTKLPWQYLIIDEAHRIKNENSALANVVRTFVTAHRLLITGTPLQNNLHELWALLNFLLPDVFASSEAFDSWFNLAADSKDEEAKAAMVKQLHRVLKPFMLRRLKADVAKALPPKTETLLYVGMTKLQRDLYRSILMRNMDAVVGERGGTDKTRLANLLMHLRKACNHPYLFEGVEDRALDPLGEHLINNCAKLQLLDKLLPKLKARGSRCLIFSQMTTLLDILEDYCVIRGYEYCRIDGNTDYEVREQSIEDYNAPGSDKFIFLLSTRAGGLGINLATADVVILYDSDWNPQADLQAQDRAHRIGQTKPVSVYRLITEGSVEEKVVERALMKLKLDAVVVQQGRLGDKAKAMSKEEMQAMITFGADAVVRSLGDVEDPNACVTDADIDTILEVGKNKTKTLADALTAKVGTNGSGLLDFKLDTTSTQLFEGVDYSSATARKAEAEKARALKLALLQSTSAAMGERSAKRSALSYNEQLVFKTLQASETTGSGNSRSEAARLRALIPPEQRPPQRMEAWTLLDARRIREITAMQIAHLQEQKEKATSEPFPDELIEERANLIAAGFPHWRRPDFQTFLKAMGTHGRAAYEMIAADMSRGAKKFTAEEIERYSSLFFALGPLPDYFGTKWKSIISIVERGEARLGEAAALCNALVAHIARYDTTKVVPRTRSPALFDAPEHALNEFSDDDSDDGEAAPQTFVPMYKGDPYHNLVYNALSYTGKLAVSRLFAPCNLPMNDGRPALPLTTAAGNPTNLQSGPEDAFSSTRWCDVEDSFLLCTSARMTIKEQIASLSLNAAARSDPAARATALATAAGKGLDGVELRKAVLRSDRFRFDYWIRSRSEEELSFRTLSLQRNAEKGCVELFRKHDKLMNDRETMEERSRKEFARAIQSAASSATDSVKHLQTQLNNAEKLQLSGTKRPATGESPGPSPPAKMHKKSATPQERNANNTASISTAGASDLTEKLDRKANRAPTVRIDKTRTVFIGGKETLSKDDRRFQAEFVQPLLKHIHGATGQDMDQLVQSFMKDAQIQALATRIHEKLPAGERLNAKFTKVTVQKLAGKKKEDGVDKWFVLPEYVHYIDAAPEAVINELNKTPLTTSFVDRTYVVAPTEEGETANAGAGKPAKTTAAEKRKTAAAASASSADAEKSVSAAAVGSKSVTSETATAAPKPHRPRMMRTPSGGKASGGPSSSSSSTTTPQPRGSLGSLGDIGAVVGPARPVVALPSAAAPAPTPSPPASAPYSFTQALNGPGKALGAPHGSLQALASRSGSNVSPIKPDEPLHDQLGINKFQLIDLMQILRSSPHMALSTLSSTLVRFGFAENVSAADAMLRKMVVPHPAKPGGWQLRAEFLR